ncbi:MAG: hypothetical protein CFE24_07580 [Flavobacterium sp. BFFFF2]|nr:MAG: hypothetical protein CFE24_07580 [Flavobacterium sp. BFFFF2]
MIFSNGTKHERIKKPHYYFLFSILQYLFIVVEKSKLVPDLVITNRKIDKPSKLLSLRFIRNKAIHGNYY